MRVEIKVDGMDTLSEILDGIPEQIIPLASIGLERGLEETQAVAKSLAVEDTGEMREKISTNVQQDGSSVEGKVVAGAEHSIFVEMGTGPRGAESPPPAAIEQGATYRAGGWVYPTKDGGFRYTEGQEARPFMDPAYKQTKDSIIDAVISAIKEGLA